MRKRDITRRIRQRLYNGCKFPLVGEGSARQIDVCGSEISMKSEIFDKRYFNVPGEILDLRLINVFEPDNGDLPFYWWDIILKTEHIAIGKISLRLGENRHSYYNGNIGYEIDKEYQGRHYALLACEMVLPIAKAHGMDKLYLTCDYDNVPSYKTIERLGGTLIEEIEPPTDYIHYYEGIPKHKIYELKI